MCFFYYYQIKKNGSHNGCKAVHFKLSSAALINNSFLAEQKDINECNFFLERIIVSLVKIERGRFKAIGLFFLLVYYY
jgi:hypothetical protein